MIHAFGRSSSCQRVNQISSEKSESAFYFPKSTCANVVECCTYLIAHSWFLHFVKINKGECSENQGYLRTYAPWLCMLIRRLPWPVRTNTYLSRSLKPFPLSLYHRSFDRACSTLDRCCYLCGKLVFTAKSTSYIRPERLRLKRYQSLPVNHSKHTMKVFS